MVSTPPPGETAVQLPWLSPCTATLLGLLHSASADAWSELRLDPAGVLWVVRRAAPPSASPPPNLLALLAEPAVLEGMDSFLSQPEVGFVDWRQPSVRAVYECCLTYAQLAERLAWRCRRCPPETAWGAALLAPLGWLAVCAVAPEQVQACWRDPNFTAHPTQTQRCHWGYDQASIARRLARRWLLPNWLAVVVGHLSLPPAVGRSLGGDPHLLSVVQLAVGLAQRQQPGLGLSIPYRLADIAAALGLTSSDLQAVSQEPVTLPATPSWTSPYREPLVRQLLHLAADNRRFHGVAHVHHLEGTIDQLDKAVRELDRHETTRLRTLKLDGLAELAAGAGHEINNPLAVISGQAQYLLNREEDADKQRALRTIITQAQRIHDILHGLMQFARPPRPQKHLVSVLRTAQEVIADLHDLAEQRRVQVQCEDVDANLHIGADPNQLHTMLTCLLRNAIEAAPVEGWARIRVEQPRPEWLHIVVEDNGPGPQPAQREHLFDPFFSGRSAGRSLGLGLPTAWRLAREHGGDVYWDERLEGPTRFVLRLPQESHRNGSLNNGHHTSYAVDEIPPANGNLTTADPPRYSW
ncbi:MAG: ATP-binding protein [Gemmataceae bacterium]